MMVVAEANGHLSAYENDIRYPWLSQDSYPIVNFYPPSGEGDDPADLSGLWCINQSRSSGMFC